MHQDTLYLPTPLSNPEVRYFDVSQLTKINQLKWPPSGPYQHPLDHLKQLFGANEQLTFCQNLNNEIEIRGEDEGILLTVQQTNEILPRRPDLYVTLIQTSHVFTDSSGHLALVASELHSVLGKVMQVFSAETNFGRVQKSLHARDLFSWYCGGSEKLEFKGKTVKGERIFTTQWDPSAKEFEFVHQTGRIIGRLIKSPDGRVTFTMALLLNSRIKSLMLVAAYSLFLQKFV